MHMETRVLRQLGFHGGVLVRRIVIDDHVKREILGGLLVDLLEEGQPLLMTVLTFDAADQFSLQIIQRSE